MIRNHNPAGHTGLVDNLLALVSALTEFFADRFALVAQESKMALMQLVVLGACLVLAMVVSLLGYIFLIASAIIGVAQLAEISWVWTALAAAGAHFVVALVLLLIARNRITKPFFRMTLTQLKEDREWIKTLKLTGQRVS
jgi:uncharacterized membrane protein YqjE